ncbi:MAG: hypothetical protein VYD54_09035 [Bdellovibrionota bacterium]|nr:hypothetical protein [Bdellovibrionota bacterium]
MQKPLHFSGLGDYTTSQKEAAINEFKGNLFEFLVGQWLARFYGEEAAFLSRFKGPLKKNIVGYEKWLREFDPGLLRSLPILSEKTANIVLEYLPQDIKNIFVVGKSIETPTKKSLKEADLLILSTEKEYLLSLKLCKTNAFVNTKSGGVKSFLEKYFGDFDQALLWQERLSFCVDKSFNQMAYQLYEREGLDFEGSFDNQWEDAGLSSLPGQLPKDYLPLVLEHYHRVITCVYQAFEFFFKNDREKFKKCLFPLLGIGHRDIIQITCFHGETTEQKIKKKYQLKGIHVMTGDILQQELKSLKINGLKKGLSSFDICLESLTLQIRVKPMNIFTVPGMKVNCSVKKIMKRG